VWALGYKNGAFSVSRMEVEKSEDDVKTDLKTYH